MGDIVNLIPDRQKLRDNYELIVDLARFAEGITDEAAVRKKYRLADETWDALGEDDEFCRAVTDEKTRRIRNGSHKREKAQLLVVKAPDVAASIMNRADANDRHRLDAAKVLNDLAANPADNSPAAAGFFQITINLGADTDGKPVIERYNKPITICADDVVPNDGSVPRPGPSTIANKPWDEGDVVATPAAKTPVKTIERAPVGVEKTPEQIALEAMINRGWEC